MGKILLFGGWMMEQLFVVGLVGGNPLAFLNDTCNKETIFISTVLGFFLPLFVRIIVGPIKSLILNLITSAFFVFLTIIVSLNAPIPLTYNAWWFILSVSTLWTFNLYLFTMDGLITDKIRQRIIRFFMQGL